MPRMLYIKKILTQYKITVNQSVALFFYLCDHDFMIA